MIIKGLFGNNDDEVSQKKAELVKFCSICQEPMKEDNGDNHCKDCDEKGYHKEASYWKNHFAQKKTNLLSPQMQRLADKLNDNKKSLLEGVSSTRQPGYVSDRNLNQIQKSTIANNQVDFSVIKAQISNILPNILAEMGLKDKVNADLLLDLMVPLKIATPIGNMDIGKSVVRTIVAELIENINPGLIKEAGLKTHGKVASLNSDSQVLSEGIRRVSNSFNDRTRSLAQIASEDMEKPEEKNKDSEKELEHNDYVPEESNDSEKAGGVDVADSEKLNNTTTSKISDDEAEHAMLEDEAPIGEFMHEGSIRRVHQMESYESRDLSKIISANNKIKKNNILKFASNVNANQAVEAVRPSTKDIEAISAHQPIAVLKANFTDGDNLTWNCYKTNQGYLVLSNKTAFHAKDLKSFVKFAEIDETFANWEHLPESVSSELTSPFSSDIEKEEDPIAVVVIQPPDINSCPCEQHEYLESHNKEEELFDLIMELLPQVEEMFPEDSPEEQNDLALTAALDILEGKIDKIAEDKNMLLNEIGKATNHALAKIPATHDLAEATRPHMGVADQSRNGPTKPPAKVEKTYRATPIKPGESIKDAPKVTFPGAKDPSKVELPSIKKDNEKLKSQNSGPGNALFDAVAPHANKALMVASLVNIPVDKQKHINQIVAQLYKTKDEDSRITLIAGLHKSTPHLDDSQRKALLPNSLHELHDNVINLIASEDKHETENKNDEPELHSVEDLMEVTAGLSVDEFEMSVEALLEEGFSLKTILTAADRFSEKEHKQEKHIEDSEEESGKSKEDAEKIGWAKINKMKNKK